MVRTILVLKSGTHGMPIEEYAAAIRERVPDAEVELARTRGEELEKIPDATVVTSKRIDDELLANAEKMRLFACYSAGYEHLPLAELESHGVAVTNGSGIHAPNMAEQVLGNLLVFTRRLDEGWRRQRDRRWEHYQAHELKGATVTVVGLGAIGRAIVERLEPFGVETIGVRYTPAKGGPTDEVVGFDGPGFESALARTDYVVLACPLSETTEGLIGAEEFDILAPDAVLVNVARGPVVDTDALLDAVRSNQLRGAALDVTDPEPLPENHPLWNFENVHITPHMAGHTPEYYDRCADILARNLERVDETGEYRELENQVAGPE
ncbi:D-2-hydroxyacid dehydrogenase [Haladaptatus sp. DYF46]|uniref:D-2-hydroxyacid dehydrogenase n=1 Tax=Haladaptatus sp. DYF46 TaxID=2886041 RepID=UPI001E4A7465|nr:D-2-hydroxyacid dehydrogenase [Haladaptatus sp. DYF46]